MVRSSFVVAATLAFGFAAADAAFAEDTVKIGFILPMTGQQQSTGKQEAAAIKLYMAQHGDTVAGKKIELIIKDDGAVPDNTKRIAQELIVNEKVAFVAGFGVTPAALSVAPLSAESKTPSGAVLTLSLSFNNDGPLGSFFRYICDNGTYKAYYDDLSDGKDNKIDLSKVDVSMDGIELEDREFVAAIEQKREPNASLAQLLPCMHVLGRLEKIVDPQRQAHA